MILALVVALQLSASDTIPVGWVADQKTLDERKNVAQVEEMLEGRFPGVRIRRLPEGIAVQVRGSVTLTGTNTAPLYVIDGLPIESGPSGLLNLNPNDIAKIVVLKDETSLSFWGSRAGNGVVIITTKQGGK